MSSVYLMNILRFFCHRWYSVQVAVKSVIFLHSHFSWLPQVYIIKTSWESWVMICVFCGIDFAINLYVLIDSWLLSWHFRTTSPILIWIHVVKGQWVNKVTCDKREVNCCVLVWWKGQFWCSEFTNVWYTWEFRVNCTSIQFLYCEYFYIWNVL
jgi:hypothetical protein